MAQAVIVNLTVFQGQAMKKITFMCVFIRMYLTLKEYVYCVNTVSKAYIT